MALKTDIVSTAWTFDINNPGKIVQGLEAIKQNVFVILTTTKGTDPLRHDFGCNAIDYIDKPVNIGVPQMKKEIALSLAKWETRIENITVTQNLDISTSTFLISYKIKDTKITDQLNITYGNTNNS